MKKAIKISKGVLFIAIGTLFLFVVFYKVSNMNYDYYMNFYKSMQYHGYNFDLLDFIKPTIFNYLFGALFMLIGALEIKEAFTNE